MTPESIRKKIIEAVRHANEKLYLNSVLMCHMASIAVHRLPIDFGIKSEIIGGNVRVPGIDGEFIYDKHYWCKTEFGEIVDLTSENILFTWYGAIGIVWTAQPKEWVVFVETEIMSEDFSRTRIADEFYHFAKSYIDNLGA